MKSHQSRLKQEDHLSQSPGIGSAVGKGAVSLADNRPHKFQISSQTGNLSDNRPLQLKKNNTELPDKLKIGIENLSGHSLDDVKVNYNSGKPAQLQAHAYAQGNQIHLAPGQEKHLPHEAWHVVQQKQGRVQPTLQMKGGINVNDNKGLEAEADAMGTKSVVQKQAADLPPALNYGGTNTSHTVQLLSKDDAAKRLEVANDEEHQTVIEVVVLLDDIGVEVPKIEKALDGFEAFLDKAASGETIKLKGINKAGLKYQLSSTIGFLKNKFGVLSSELESIEAEYIEDKNKEKAAKDLILLNAHKTMMAEAAAKIAAMFAKTYTEEQPFEADRKILFDVRDFVVLLTTGGTGGFSALGRAHDIKLFKFDWDDKPGLDYQHDANFVNDDTHINGVPLTSGLDDKGIYKLPSAKEQTNGPVPFSEDPDTKAAADPHQTKVYKNTPSPRERGAGQLAAMGNTNARAYAKHTNTPDWDNSKWEWLHIKAASLGGETDSTNLILGTRDANTHMMPFEANVRLLGKIAAQNNLNLRVVWKANGKIKNHKYQYIVIEWAFEPKVPSPEEVDLPNGAASFNALYTGSRISKLEITYIENVLKEARNKLRKKEDQE